MPELPEVETVVRSLKAIVVGGNIVDVECLSNNKKISDNLQKFIHSKLITVYRRAKYIILKTSWQYMLIHLGMTGKLLLNTERNKHDHLKIIIANKQGENISIIFNDIRKFGFIRAIDSVEEELKNLGIEPFDLAFTVLKLKELCSNVKKNIKIALMDQKIIVGIGNIYASEILFLAGMSPLKIANNLSDTEYENLYNAIKTILQNAIAKNGTTIKDYISPKGDKGDFQNSLKVYMKEGENCSRCNNIINKIVQSARSTFYCTICQT